MYIIAAILIFGVLIAVHELGHFLAAKACGVRVNEFSIGMGPAIFHTTKGETEYSLRLLPIGGFCAMEGEDEESDDPRALERQGFWKKLLIFVAGAAMNFLTGLLIMICLYAGAQGFYTAEIVELDSAFPQQGENGIMVGDVIWAINGERIYLKSDVSTVLGVVDLDENGTIEMTVKRGGEKLKRTLTLQTYTDENGAEVRRYGFTYGGIVEATPLVRLQYSWYNTLDFVRLVRMSLMMLVSGSAGLDDLSGPVGIVSTIKDVGEEAQEEAEKNNQNGFAAAAESILYFGALIAVNLAVMNLLPLPALDGGKVFFLVINTLALALFKRQIPPKYENYIIKNSIHIPLVADIHFDYRLAIAAAEHGADKIRINPGNIGGEDRVKAVVDCCRAHKVPIRIGVNGGSLEKELLAKYGRVTPEALVESALGHVALLEKYDFTDICISVKSSDVPLNMAAYRLLHERVDYPLHLGVTEAGTPSMGVLKSAIGIGGLLCEGIGDTMRVSLTADPVEEVYAAKRILRACGLRRSGVNLISCPTCGRTAYDMIPLAEELERRLEDCDKPITVAVMGCVVNGPGEASAADIGVAGGKGEGLIFRHGEVLYKVVQEKLLDALLEEIEKL